MQLCQCKKTSDDRREAKTGNCHFPTIVLIGEALSSSEVEEKEETRQKKEEKKEGERSGPS